MIPTVLESAIGVSCGACIVPSGYFDLLLEDPRFSYLQELEPSTDFATPHLLRGAISTNQSILGMCLLKLRLEASCYALK